MNKRQNVRVDAGKRVDVFGDNHSAAFPPRAGKPGPSKAQGYWIELKAVLTEIAERFSTQIDGSYQQGSTDKGTLRHALMSDLRAINTTAKAIATEQKTPGIMDRFRLPTGHNDEQIAARGRSFAAAVTELGLEEEFLDHEHAETFLADLLGRVAEFETADDTKESALQGQAGSTSSLADLIKRVMELIKALNACVQNKFVGNAQIIGEWATASHVERTGHKPAAGTTDTPVNPA